MGKFLSKLFVEEVTDINNEGRGKFQLTKPLSYQADSGVVYTAPEGFCTDFSSVPRIPIIFDIFGDRCNDSAAIHDWLYQSDPVTKQHPVATRLMADQLLREMILAQGISSWIATCFYYGVRIGGASHWGN